MSNIKIVSCGHKNLSDYDVTSKYASKPFKPLFGL